MTPAVLLHDGTLETHVLLLACVRSTSFPRQGLLLFILIS